MTVAIRILALAGLAVGGYLTYIHYAGIAPICAASGGCEKVQSSSYAELAGVPVALLGALGYAAILATTFVRGEAGRLGGACIALAGAGFSAYLTYLELFEIHALCQWCVASAVLMLALAVLTVVRALTRTSPPSDGASVTWRSRADSDAGSTAETSTRSSTERSTSRISMSANAAPTQRRGPPPKGSQV
jgi:uncharacterized membrane protein